MAIRPEDLPKDPAALAEMVLAFDGENERSARRDRDPEGPDLRHPIGAFGDHLRRATRTGSGPGARRAASGQRRRTGTGRAEDEAAQGPTQHRRAAGASALGRAGDRAGLDALPVLHWADASDRRGDEGGARSGSRVAARAAHDPPQIRLTWGASGQGLVSSTHGNSFWSFRYPSAKPYCMTLRLHQHPACGGQGLGRRNHSASTAMSHAYLRFVDPDPPGLVRSWKI
jgi:hypothetical protein